MKQSAYVVKLEQEVAWAVAVAAGTVIVQTMVTFHPEAITDWQTWAVGIGASIVRAAGVGILALFGRAKLEGNQ